MNSTSPHARDPGNTTLVTILNGQPITTSLTIADGTGTQHKAIIQLIRRYEQDLQLFGRVTFEMRPFETNGGTQKQEFAHLNEPQFTLILTYMKNTAVIRAFKIRLVKAFYEMAKAQPQQTLRPRPSTIPPLTKSHKVDASLTAYSSLIA